MFHVIRKNRLPDVHIPDPCMQALSDASSYQLTSLTRYTYASFVLASIGLSHMPLADVLCQMCTSHVTCMQGLGDTTSHFPTLVDRYVQATIDAARQHPTSAYGSLQDTDDVSRTQSTSEYQLLQSIDNALSHHSTPIDQCVQTSYEKAIHIYHLLTIVHMPKAMWEDHVPCRLTIGLRQKVIQNVLS